MDHQALVELTADIVSAHVSNNSLAPTDVPELVRTVHDALAGLGAPAEDEPQAKTPVVSIRASVKPDYLVCMECGSKQKTLKRHLQAAHGMTPSQYRQDYGLPASYPMVAPDYAERRSALAKSLGLGRKKAAAAPAQTTPKPRKRKDESAPQGDALDLEQAAPEQTADAAAETQKPKRSRLKLKHESAES